MIEIRWGWEYSNGRKNEIVSKTINIGYKTKTFVGQSDFFTVAREYTNAETGGTNCAEEIFSSGKLYFKIKYFIEKEPEKFIAIASCSLGIIFTMILAILAKIYF